MILEVGLGGGAKENTRERETVTAIMVYVLLFFINFCFQSSGLFEIILKCIIKQIKQVENHVSQDTTTIWPVKSNEHLWINLQFCSPISTPVSTRWQYTYINIPQENRAVLVTRGLTRFGETILLNCSFQRTRSKSFYVLSSCCFTSPRAPWSTLIYSDQFTAMIKFIKYI